VGVSGKVALQKSIIRTLFQPTRCDKINALFAVFQIVGKATWNPNPLTACIDQREGEKIWSSFLCKGIWFRIQLWSWQTHSPFHMTKMGGGGGGGRGEPVSYPAHFYSRWGNCGSSSGAEGQMTNSSAFQKERALLSLSA
jgi:hypothetical protein